MSYKYQSNSVLSSISSIEDIITEHRNLKSEIKKLQDQIKEKARGAFEKGIKIVFDHFPTLNQIRWTQYTPYFNDGEECTFRSNHSDCSLNEDEDYGEYYKDEGFPEGITKEIKDTVREFLRLFDENDYEIMFGNHVAVTITPKGISIEDYDHE